jgi:hypothetical protein
MGMVDQPQQDVQGWGQSPESWAWSSWDSSCSNTQPSPSPEVRSLVSCSAVKAEDPGSLSLPGRAASQPKKPGPSQGPHSQDTLSYKIIYLGGNKVARVS